MRPMPLISAKAVPLASLLLATFHKTPSWVNNDEAPPGAFGFWLGIGLLIAAIVLVSAGLRYQRHRRLRATAVLPDDPFAVEAMRAGAGLFSRLDRAWRQRDASALAALASPSVLAGWEPRLAVAPGGELTVDGPVVVEYMGAANPAPGADRRAIVRVEGRLRPPSRQFSISTTQRNRLLGLAGVILIAAFVGIALAPATRIRSAGPTTIVVRDGVPLGGPRLLTYRRGALIDLTVSGDVADEVHFHGYDLHRDVSPGHPVHFRIRATIEGSYPVELEGHAQTLAQVTVEP
jgi:hypothetical protein